MAKAQVQPWAPADLCGHLQKQGRTDSKWRRRFCALKGPNLFILRSASAPKPLAVLHLSGAQILASKTPLYPADSDGGQADSNDVLWVLRIILQEGQGNRRSSNTSRSTAGSSGGGSSRHVKYKIAAPTRELQELWRDALQSAAEAAEAAGIVADDSIQLQLDGSIARPQTAPHRTSQASNAPVMRRPSTAAAVAAADSQDPFQGRRRARSSFGPSVLQQQQQQQQQQQEVYAARPRSSSAAGQSRQSVHSAAHAAGAEGVSNADANTDREDELEQQQQQQHTSRKSQQATRPSQMLLEQQQQQQKRSRQSLLQQPARKSEMQPARKVSMLQQQPGRISETRRVSLTGNSSLKSMPQRVSVSLTEQLPKRVSTHSLQQGNRVSLLQQPPPPPSQQQQRRASEVQRRASSAPGGVLESDLSHLQPQKVTQLQFMAARLSQSGGQPLIQPGGGAGRASIYGVDSSSGGIGMKRTSLVTATAAAAAVASGGSKGGKARRHRRGSRHTSSSSCSSDNRGSETEGAGASGGSDGGGSDGGGGSDSTDEASGSSSSSDGGDSNSSSRIPNRRHVAGMTSPHNWGLGQLCCWFVAPVSSSSNSGSSSYDSDSTMHSWGDDNKHSSRSSNIDGSGSSSDDGASSSDDSMTNNAAQHRRHKKHHRRQQQQRRSSTSELHTPPRQQRISASSSSRSRGRDTGNMPERLSLRPARQSAAGAAAAGAVGAVGVSAPRISARQSNLPAVAAPRRSSRSSTVAAAGVGGEPGLYYSGRDRQSLMLQQSQQQQQQQYALREGATLQEDSWQDSQDPAAPTAAAAAEDGYGPYVDEADFDIAADRTVQASPSLAVWYDTPKQQQQQYQGRKSQRASMAVGLPADQQQQQDWGISQAAPDRSSISLRRSTLAPGGSSRISSSNSRVGRVASRSMATSTTGLIDVRSAGLQDPAMNIDMNVGMNVGMMTDMTDMNMDMNREQLGYNKGVVGRRSSSSSSQVKRHSSNSPIRRPVLDAADAAAAAAAAAAGAEAAEGWQVAAERPTYVASPGVRRTHRVSSARQSALLQQDFDWQQQQQQMLHSVGSDLPNVQQHDWEIWQQQQQQQQQQQRQRVSQVTPPLRQSQHRVSVNPLFDVPAVFDDSTAAAAVRGPSVAAGSAGGPAQVLHVDRSRFDQELTSAGAVEGDKGPGGLQEAAWGLVPLLGPDSVSQQQHRASQMGLNSANRPSLSAAAAAAAAAADVDSAPQTAGEWWARRRSSQGTTEGATAAATAAAAVDYDGGGWQQQEQRLSNSSNISGLSVLSAPDGLSKGASTNLALYDDVSRQLRAQALQQQQQQQQQQQMPSSKADDVSWVHQGAVDGGPHFVAPSIASAVKRFEHLFQQQFGQQQQQHQRLLPNKPQTTPAKLPTQRQYVASDAGRAVHGSVDNAASAALSAGAGSQGGVTPQHAWMDDVSVLCSRQQDTSQQQQQQRQQEVVASIIAPLTAAVEKGARMSRQSVIMAEAAAATEAEAPVRVPHLQQHAAAVTAAAATAAVGHEATRPAPPPPPPLPTTFPFPEAPTAAAAAAAANTGGGGANKLASSRPGPPPPPPLPAGGKLPPAQPPAPKPPADAAAGQAAAGKAAEALPAALAAAVPGREALLQAIRGGAKLHHVHRASMVAAQQAGML